MNPPTNPPTISWKSPGVSKSDLPSGFQSEFLLNCDYPGLIPLPRVVPDPWVERWATRWIETRLQVPTFETDFRCEASVRALSCFQIFGLHMKLPESITSQPTWHCALSSMGNWLVFEINRETVCAQWKSHEEPTREELQSLSKNILGISFAGTGIHRAPCPKNFPSLQSVSFWNCGRLECFQELRGMTTLWDLTLSGASVLKDFSPLCDLPGLQILTAADIDHAPDALQLKFLSSLQTLDLECNHGIRSLEFLLSTPEIESLSIRGTRVGHLCDWPISQIPSQLKSLSIKGVSLEVGEKLRETLDLETYIIKTIEGPTLTNLEA